MAKPLNMPFRFPVKGLDEYAAYFAADPGTTRGCLNVLPFDTGGERIRGGKRPGTARVIAEQVDQSDTPVQRMRQITLASGTPIAGFDWDDPAFDVGSGSDGEGVGGGWLRYAPDYVETQWPEPDPEMPPDPDSGDAYEVESPVDGEDYGDLTGAPEYDYRIYEVEITGVEVPEGELGNNTNTLTVEGGVNGSYFAFMPTSFQADRMEKYWQLANVTTAADPPIREEVDELPMARASVDSAFSAADETDIAHIRFVPGFTNTLNVTGRIDDYPLVQGGARPSVIFFIAGPGDSTIEDLGVGDSATINNDITDWQVGVTQISGGSSETYGGKNGSMTITRLQ